MKLLKKFEDGFILFITLMMLIIFAILGIGLYQQTTSSTVNVQYVTFKQEAEDLAMLALNELEANLSNSKYSNEMRPECGKKVPLDPKDPNKPTSEVLVDKELRCDPISDEVINNALTELRETGGLTGGTNNINGWNNLNKFENSEGEKVGLKGTFSGDGNVFFIIQQLGRGGNDPWKPYLLFRITVIARVLDAYSVISAISAVPANSIQAPQP